MFVLFFINPDGIWKFQPSHLLDDSFQKSLGMSNKICNYQDENKRQIKHVFVIRNICLKNEKDTDHELWLILVKNVLYPSATNHITYKNFENSDNYSI